MILRAQRAPGYVVSSALALLPGATVPSGQSGRKPGGGLCGWTSWEEVGRLGWAARGLAPRIGRGVAGAGERPAAGPGGRLEGGPAPRACFPSRPAWQRGRGWELRELGRARWSEGRRGFQSWLYLFFATLLRIRWRTVQFTPLEHITQVLVLTKFAEWCGRRREPAVGLYRRPTGAPPGPLRSLLAPTPRDPRGALRPYGSAFSAWDPVCSLYFFPLSMMCRLRRTDAGVCVCARVRICSLVAGWCFVWMDLSSPPFTS